MADEAADLFERGRLIETWPRRPHRPLPQRAVRRFSTVENQRKLNSVA
jgi:hypothetical protein